ncbi:MAG: class I SAM-dependent methyltransferase [Rhodoferax sp.]|nr:class I SAM-dependent methyltransferase [Rhodoferax sp.]
MSRPIINLNQWLETPAGQYLLAWEQAQIDAAVADIFGYHALQLGLAPLNGLHGNRMPHQWLALDRQELDRLAQLKQQARPVALLCDYAALPFASSSLDLLVLPHTLEFSPDPHATLREVERVLVPEGRVVICGLNPLSLWGLRQGRARLYRSLGLGKLFLPDSGQFIGAWRLRDWLRLLSLEVEQDVFGCYRPALQSNKWLQRCAWMDHAGSRWWPIFGAAYCMVAVKRVRGMRLLEPVWKAKPARAVKPVSVAGKQGKFTQGEFSQLEKQE